MGSEDTIIKSSKVEFVDSGIFSSDYAECLEQLQKENDELKFTLNCAKEINAAMEEKNNELEADVERLRKALYFIAQDYSTDNINYLHPYSVAESALEQSPPQSLNHIRAQVEEETINRCRSVLREYGVALYIEEYLEGMQRKYKEQSDED